MSVDDIRRLLFSVWRREHGVMHSPLSPQRCADALSGQIDGRFSLFGDREAIGHIGREGGALTRRIRYRNSFQTVLRLTFEARGAGTRVSWTAGPSIFATAFMVLWFGFILLWAAIAIPAAAIEPELQAPFVLAPIGMVAGGLLIVVIGRWLARDEQRLLLALTAKTLQADFMEPRRS